MSLQYLIVQHDTFVSKNLWCDLYYPTCSLSGEDIFQGWPQPNQEQRYVHAMTRKLLMYLVGEY